MRFKTKEEFIKSVMDGNVWEEGGGKYFYDKSKDNPFRMNNGSMEHSWRLVISENFTLVEPEPIIERRWKMLKNTGGKTDCSCAYCNSQELIYLELQGWYKHPTDYIDVEVKD